MTAVGIEALNVYAGVASLDVSRLAEHRKLDMARFQNLLMRENRLRCPMRIRSPMASTPPSRSSTR